MQTDFNDAAHRHFEDAHLLERYAKIANADHLFGLSAECALKAVMQGLGMTLTHDGVPSNKQYRVHINKLWNQFSCFASGRNATKYAQCLDPNSNPFNNWTINHRYFHRSNITAQMLLDHKKGAQTAMNLLGQATLDGVVT
jgi:hypothetical protein